MIYPTDFEHKIDFQVIRERLMELCTFSMGREKVSEVCFLTDYSAISALLGETQEMLSILTDATFSLPQPEMHDMREALARIRIEGLYLNEEELFRLRKALDSVMQYVEFFASLPEERFPRLSGWVPEVPHAEFDEGMGRAEELPEVPYRHLLSQIDRLMDKYGKIKDNASPELARIRRELQQAEGSVARTLSSILRQAQADGIIDKDAAPTMREGRLVLPVPPAYKRKIGGIVHDESATGKTVFIEPQQVVEANNRIRELESDERRECTRILIAFANELRPYVPGIRFSQRYLAHIDFLRAKALFAKDIQAIAPELTDQPMIDIRVARHPVLYINFRRQQKEVVPLTLSLDADKRILIISGPNAGGKSVCLKTVALLQYMLQCGIPVPVREDSKMGIFEHILIDIGDQQSIEDDLSTYSSHLRNMKQFVRTAGKRTLFLIDEFGGGTEPLLGGAIAEAILERLCDNGAYGVVTTHYTNLKHFAEDHEAVINGAMLYDRGALRPLFQLSVGQPGSSFALEIAQQIGLPYEIVEAAKALIGDENIHYDRHLQDIARDKRYWENKRQQIRQKEKHLEERIQQYEEQMQEVKARKRQIIEDARTEAAELLQKSNRTIENTIRQIRESQADKERTKAARQRLETLKEDMSAKPEPPKPKKDKRKPAANPAAPAETPTLSVGTHVRLEGQSVVGEILEISGKKAIVAFGAMRSQVALSKLEYVSNNQARKIQTGKMSIAPASAISDTMRQRKLSFTQELDLRGMRADEALQEVMTYIDDAVMVGAEEVRILHGTGTGVLKQVIRQWLKGQRKIHAFHDGDPDKGGAGITIVEF